MRDKSHEGEIDWSRTTWEGSRREQIRHWARLPLRDVLRAVEEMELLAEKLGHTPHRHKSEAEPPPDGSN